MPELELQSPPPEHTNLPPFPPEDWEQIRASVDCWEAKYAHLLPPVIQCPPYSEGHIICMMPPGPFPEDDNPTTPFWLSGFDDKPQDFRQQAGSRVRPDPDSVSHHSSPSLTPELLSTIDKPEASLTVPSSSSKLDYPLKPEDWKEGHLLDSRWESDKLSDPFTDQEVLPVPLSPYDKPDKENDGVIYDYVSYPDSLPDLNPVSDLEDKDEDEPVSTNPVFEEDLKSASAEH
ncbi:hypothetical protein JAAARDRAFT_189571 [Jaapia argillacea MUCL 33604]|uniref:Uncharacterized protein n=1 Tax=Jaapia argillacea MUCL 33604 TaxID=933084 RepID=A0A067QFD4_9AGAM|nr:hypothetical protein JAAARDRAFT_189571 [Jaapia argillacea MUCL 33604]